MAIKPWKGQFKMVQVVKKASTAFNQYGLVYPDGSGAYQPADATSGSHLGVTAKAVTSSDSDYATSGALFSVIVPRDDDCEWIADVGTGTMTTALVGTYCDLKDDDELDVSATSKNVVFLSGFKSATQAYMQLTSRLNRFIATT